METLGLLEELRQDYAGTVLLVSHDRECLNKGVTQTLAAEEGGHWREYVGGYDEWVEQRPAPIDEGPLTKPRKKEAAAGSKSKTEKSGKITAWELREQIGRAHV